MKDFTTANHGTGDRVFNADGFPGMQLRGHGYHKTGQRVELEMEMETAWLGGARWATRRVGDSQWNRLMDAGPRQGNPPRTREKDFR